MSDVRPETRLYRPGEDDHLVVRLFNLVFEEKTTPELWRHKYAENPDGGWAFLTFVEGELVSVSGWPVRRLLLDGEVHRVVSMSDVMVHPAWRGRYGGRLGSIARPLWERIFTEAGIPFGVAFPNPKHYLVGKRFVRARDLGRFRTGVEVFSRFWRVRPLAELLRRVTALRLRLPRGFEAEEISPGTVPPETLALLDDLWGRVRRELRVAYVKDAVRLSWRYFRWEELSPERRRRFILLREGEEPRAFLSLREVFIGGMKGFELEEIVCSRSEAGRALGAARCLAVRAGGHFLRYLLSPALGLSATPEREVPALWRTFACRGEIEDLEGRLDPERWHLTLGDTAV